MKARISKKGAQILSDRATANAVVQAILQNREELMSGKTVDFKIILSDLKGEEKEEKGQIQVVQSSYSFTE